MLLSSLPSHPSQQHPPSTASMPWMCASERVEPHTCRESGGDCTHCRGYDAIDDPSLSMICTECAMFTTEDGKASGMCKHCDCIREFDPRFFWSAEGDGWPSDTEEETSENSEDDRTDSEDEELAAAAESNIQERRAAKRKFDSGVKPPDLKRQKAGANCSHTV